MDVFPSRTEVWNLNGKVLREIRNSHVAEEAPSARDAVLPGIPQRIRTPGSELSNNINQVTATGIPIGLEGMSIKVWWAGGSQ